MLNRFLRASSCVQMRVARFLCLCVFVSAPALQAANNPLVLGVFPRYNATENMTMYTPLAEYLGERLGREVTLVTAKDFESFWSGVETQRYDLVHFNQFHYIQAARTYRVIAHTKEFGRSAVAGAIFVRKDSGITDVSQLRGRTVMFGGGRDAMMSYIAPMFLIKQAGLKEGQFKSQFAVNPPNALLALYHRQADAAGGGEILIDLSVVRNAIDAGELRVIASTEPLLFLPWAVKHTMPEKMRSAIQSLLVSLEQSEAGRGVLRSARITGIGKAQDKDYNAHRKMTDAVFGRSRAAR